MKAPTALVELVKDAIGDPTVADEIRTRVLNVESRPANEPIQLSEVATLTAIVGDLSRQIAGLAEVVAGQSPLVDLKTAAKHLSVSTRTLRRMVAADELPYRRFGRTLRFNLGLLAPKRRGGPATAPPPSRRPKPSAI